MSPSTALQDSIHEVGRAVRRPEELVRRWRDRVTEAARLEAAPSWLVFPLLLASAIFGVAVYGMTMRLHAGAGAMLGGAVRAPLAAGTAWLLALPALYILNSLLGSRLDLSTTVLAALVTVSFGSLALLASVPINWFFTLAIPDDTVRLAVNLVIFTGVGVAMADVFIRMLKALEPERSSFYGYLWLTLVGVIGAELFVLLGVFRF